MTKVAMRATEVLNFLRALNTQLFTRPEIETILKQLSEVTAHLDAQMGAACGQESAVNTCRDASANQVGRQLWN